MLLPSRQGTLIRAQSGQRHPCLPLRATDQHSDRATVRIFRANVSFLKHVLSFESPFCWNKHVLRLEMVQTGNTDYGIVIQGYCESA